MYSSKIGLKRFFSLGVLFVFWSVIGCEAAFDIPNSQTADAAATAITPPSAPTGLTATKDGTAPTSKINLAWTDSSDNESSFEIVRSTDAVTFTSLASVSSNTTSYSDSTCSGNTTYYYKVRAINTGGNSDYSSVANATTDRTGPCGNTTTIGAVCSEGGIYAGTYNGSSYMTTGSNCNNAVSPSCDENPVAALRVPDTMYITWGARTTTGATNTTDGKLNISAILSANPSGTNAARFCDLLQYAGYDDWYLPAKEELNNVLQPNTVAIGGFDPNTNTSPFPRYLSSTEANTNRAYARFLVPGSSEETPNKDAQSRVRCVRRW